MADSSLDLILKVGEIVTIIGSVGVGLFTIGRSTSRMETLITTQAEDIIGVKTELKKLTDVITVQAVQTTRIDNLSSLITSVDKRVEELRRGVGWVTGRKGIEGEYP
jgi:hypothetical protein